MAEYEHAGGRRVEVEVEADASPDRVWEAWADPEKLAGWFVDRARGRGETGGEMTWYFEGFGEGLPYRVLESVPGERIVFGPATDDGPPFVLEIVIARHAGSTRVRLVNSGFSEAADFDDQFGGIDSGWRMALAALKEYVERHFGEARTGFTVLRPARVEYDDVRRAFVSRDGLARWLGTARSDVGEPGSPVSIGLRHGGTLTGRVLARTEREVALSWDEIAGVLELKAFARGPEREVGVRGWGWGLDAARARGLESRLAPAVERLVATVQARPDVAAD